MWLIFFAALTSHAMPAYFSTCRTEAIAKYPNYESQSYYILRCMDAGGYRFDPAAQKCHHKDDLIHDAYVLDCYTSERSKHH